MRVFTNVSIFEVSIILQYVPEMLELIQRCLADADRQEPVMKGCYGLLGDLAEAFRNGQIKDLLLAEWIAAELRQKGRMSGEVRRNLRYAREVRFIRSLLSISRIFTRRFLQSVKLATA